MLLCNSWPRTHENPTLAFQVLRFTGVHHHTWPLSFLAGGRVVLGVKHSLLLRSLCVCLYVCMFICVCVLCESVYVCVYGFILFNFFEEEFVPCSPRCP